jgi:hypothetical protein
MAKNRSKDKMTDDDALYKTGKAARKAFVAAVKKNPKIFIGGKPTTD